MKSPYSTGVYEEYVIYDMIAMISAIGGTMGICIGFSFTNVADMIILFLEHLSSNFYTSDENDKSMSNKFVQQGLPDPFDLNQPYLF